MPSPYLLAENLIRSLKMLSVLLSDLMVKFLRQRSLIAAPIVDIPLETIGFTLGAVYQLFDEGIYMLSHSR
jgi:hypothetical protein